VIHVIVDSFLARSNAVLV